MSDGPRIGIALSGGGVRGLAHVGVLQALRENGVDPVHFSGTSAGALVGAMAAADCTIDQMLDFWLTTKPFRVAKIAASGSLLTRPGIFRPETYVDDLKRYVPFERFEDLPRRLSVTVAAMLAGEGRVIDAGPLWPIVMASAAFPLAFSPVPLDDEMYMDGGIIDNFPVQPVRATCDVVIGVDVSSQRSFTAEHLSTVRGIIERLMDLGFGADSAEQGAACDVCICPEGANDYGSFDTGAMLDLYQLGYQAGCKAMPAVRAALAAHA